MKKVFVLLLLTIILSVSLSRPGYAPAYGADAKEDASFKEVFTLGSRGISEIDNERKLIIFHK